MGLTTVQEQVVREILLNEVAKIRSKIEKDPELLFKVAISLEPFIAQEKEGIKERVLGLCNDHYELRGVEDFYLYDFIDNQLDKIKMDLLAKQQALEFPVARNRGASSPPEQRGGGAAAPQEAAVGAERELPEPTTGLNPLQKLIIKQLFSADLPDMMETKQFSPVPVPQEAIHSKLPAPLLARCLLDIPLHLQASDQEYRKSVTGIPAEVRAHIDEIREFYCNLFRKSGDRHHANAVQRLGLNVRKEPKQEDVSDEDVRKYLHYLIEVKIIAARRNAEVLGVSSQDIQVAIAAGLSGHAVAEPSGHAAAEQFEDREFNENAGLIVVFAEAQKYETSSSGDTVELVFQDRQTLDNALERLRRLTGRDCGLIGAGLAITIPRQYIQLLASRIKDREQRLIHIVQRAASVHPRPQEEEHRERPGVDDRQQRLLNILEQLRRHQQHHRPRPHR